MGTDARWPTSAGRRRPAPATVSLVSSSTLLDHITSAVADEYTVLGQLGESSRGSAFLARERAGGHLVVLAVPPSADELSVLAALGDEVPANAGTCTTCGEAPPTFTTFCPSCGRAFVQNAVGAHRFTADEVRAAATPAYDLLGEVAHQSGGSLFFVRDQADRRLVALSGQPAPGGGQALEAVWDAIRGERPASTATDPAAYGGVTSGPSSADAFGATDSATEYASEGPPGYPPDYVPPAVPDADGAPVARRRRWVPVAIAGAVVLAAGGAWAVTRGTRQAPRPITTALPDTVAVVPPPQPAVGTGSTTAAGGAGSPPPPEPQPTAPGASTVTPTERAPVIDSSRLPLANAEVQLDGAGLPTGWTWTINGRRGPASLTARLRPNHAAVLTIEAPGYCPETLQLAPLAPGAVQRWAPRLRGKPMVGEC